MGLYRGIFVICLRYLEKGFSNFPQYDFHMQVIDELISKKSLSPDLKEKIIPKLEDLNLISASATRLLIKNDDGIFRKELGFGNGQVHLIYSTMILAMFGVFFSILKSGFGALTIIFIALFILLLIGGLKFNHLMDMRETLFLIEYREDYSKLLELYIDFIIKRG